MSNSPSAAAAPSLRRSSLRLIAAGGALALAGILGTTAIAGASPVPDPKEPNAAAKRAGVERGNATMGWKDGVERPAGGQPTAGSASDSRVGAYAKITRAGKLVAMTGVLGIDVSSYQGVVDWVSFRKVK